MGLVWTPIATAMILASTVATFFTMMHLRCRWDVHASSVRWLFWLFFVYVFLWCAFRSIFYVWISILSEGSLIVKNASAANTTDAGSAQRSLDDNALSEDQLDRISIHAILLLTVTKWPLMTLVLCLGDITICGVATTVFPLTYELWRLAKTSMDRGVKMEQRQILIYTVAIHVVVGFFAVAEFVLCVREGGYNRNTQQLTLVLYVVQFVSMAFMAGQLIMLKVNGRKYETIHGTFVESPVYQRLKRIMLVYILFSFQYQLATIVIYSRETTISIEIAESVGVSLILYNASGLMLSITTSCSQACVFSACSTCLPEDFEAEYLHRRLSGASAAPSDEDLEAPTRTPVFVYTDIESSSALWAIGDGKIMQTAIEIHDNILRSTIPKHRGYEITTVGDAFQVAFHNNRQAIEYCMDVQLQLMVAKWPKDIHGAVPATTKLRSGRKVIFNGLRVRMGIHDANASDGALVQDVHAVTGKATYTGVSEVIAECVGDLGSGGQILLTDRVADWLKHHRKELSLDVYLEYLGEYIVPQVNANVALYQVLPMLLAERRKHFATLRTEFVATQRRIGLSPRSDCRLTCAAFPASPRFDFVATALPPHQSDSDANREVAMMGPPQPRARRCSMVR